MSEIFSITHTDKRDKFVNKELKTTQKPHGSDVEHFDHINGFCLLEKQAKINYGLTYVKRARAAAELSQGVPLALREFYYTLGQTPKLMEPFKSIKVDAVYQTVLRAINDLEILCDVDRAVFTVGSNSKGFIYYAQSERFGNKRLKVGFTEEIAREVLQGEELENCNAIVVVEKMAAANRLVDLGFSELTNSVIVTTGGNFNRAIWLITERFKDSKKMVFFCDADPYGVDMNRTIQVGTESSRHLDFKFNPKFNPNIFLSGLFPSIGEQLGLPVDKEQKLPSNSPHTRKRIDFLHRHGLVDPRDYDAWMRDKTYELEGLSTAFKNGSRQPIGLALYLLEYMRFYGIPIKPGLPSDDELVRLFREKVKEELMEKIDAGVEYPRWFWNLYNRIKAGRESAVKQIFEEMEPDLDTELDKVGAKEIKFHINRQFIEDPTRANYDLKSIAAKLRKEFEVDLDWTAKEGLNKVDQVVRDLFDEGLEGATPGYSSTFIFEAIHNETNLQNPYDIALSRLDADEQDVVTVRHAVEWRFADE